VSVKRNLVANYIGAGWAGLMNLAFLPLYIDYLGIEAYGLVGLFATIQAWFALLDLGLSPTLNREMARFSAGQHTQQSIRDLLRSMECIYAGIAVLLTIAMITMSSVMATKWLKTSQLSSGVVTEAFILMGIGLAFRWMTVLYRSAILGLQRQVWLNGLTVLTATLRGPGAVGVLAVTPTIQAFFMFQAVVSLVEMAALLQKTYRLLPKVEKARFGLSTLESVWKFAAGMTTITVLATLLTQVDKVILSRILLLSDFGYFTFATTVAGAIYILIIPVANVAYPRFSEIVALGNESQLIDEYHRFAQLVSVLVIPAALVLSAFSHEIVLIWSGNEETAAHTARIISFWVLGSALNGLMYIPYMAQLAYGWSRLTVMVNVLAVVLIIPAFLIFVPKFGGIAAAYIWIIINSGYILLNISLMHTRILKAEKWHWYFQDNLLPLLAGLAMLSMMLPVVRMLPDLGRWGEAGFIALVLVLVYLAAALATPLGRQILGSSREMLKKLTS